LPFGGGYAVEIGVMSVGGTPMTDKRLFRTMFNNQNERTEYEAIYPMDASSN